MQYCTGMLQCIFYHTKKVCWLYQYNTFPSVSWGKKTLNIYISCKDYGWKSIFMLLEFKLGKFTVIIFDVEIFAAIWLDFFCYLSFIIVPTNKGVIYSGNMISPTKTALISLSLVIHWKTQSWDWWKWFKFLWTVLSITTF